MSRYYADTAIRFVRISPDASVGTIAAKSFVTFGNRFACCSTDRRRQAYVAEHGMVAFYWTNGPLTYALSGEMPRDDLLHLAQMVHDDLVSRSS